MIKVLLERSQININIGSMAKHLQENEIKKIEKLVN